jgi:hypothetical protein
LISDCRFRFYSLQLSLFAGGINDCWLNVVEVVDESTRASGGGQLPKFGAVDEKVGKGFSGRVGIKKKFLVDGFSYAELGLSDRFKLGRRMPTDFRKIISTALAQELQKSSSQFLFLRCQLDLSGEGNCGALLRGTVVPT